MKSALAHGAASLREATEAMRLALRASAPAQLELGTRARQIASSVGEGAGLVAVGIAASERAFSRRTGMSEWVLRVIVAAIVMGVGSLAVTFADTIKAFMGAQASKAVSGVLRDEDIRNSASLTVSELAERLLADDELRTASAAFLQGLMAAPETRAALLDLLVWALQEESTRQQLVALLSHEATLRATRDLLIWAFSDPATRRQMEQLASWLLADESFQLVGVRALLGVLNSTLDDKPLRDHAAEALSSVVADTSLQQRTGEALWNAVAWSVTPSILRSPDGKPEAAVPDAAALAPAPPADAAQTVDGAQAGSVGDGDSAAAAAAAAGATHRQEAGEPSPSAAPSSAPAAQSAPTGALLPGKQQADGPPRPAVSTANGPVGRRPEPIELAPAGEGPDTAPRGRFGVRLHRDANEAPPEVPVPSARVASATGATQRRQGDATKLGRAAAGAAPQAAQHEPAGTASQTAVPAGARRAVPESGAIPSPPRARLATGVSQSRSPGSSQAAGGEPSGQSRSDPHPPARAAASGSQNATRAGAEDAQFVAEWKQPLHLLESGAQTHDQRA